MRLLAATTNTNKFAELNAVATRFGIELLHPRELQSERSLPTPPEVEENLPNYRGNAVKKAAAYSAWGGMPAIGDDSGLEVTILNGAPGVYSARYAATDSEKISRLLSEINRAEQAANTRQRQAQFRCVLALVNGDKIIAESEYTLGGEILDQPRGSGGFGYDPIVLISSWGKTLAEVDFSVTCSEGFRAQAATLLFSKIAEKIE